MTPIRPHHLRESDHVKGLGFRVQGPGFRVQGLGFRVYGLRFSYGFLRLLGGEYFLPGFKVMSSSGL